MSVIRYATNTIWRILLGFAIMVLCLEAGTLISHYLPFKFPDSIIGLLILFILLNFQIIRLKWIEQAAGLLLKHMSLLFIPVAVALLGYLNVFMQSLLVIVINICLGIICIVFIIGNLYQRMNRQ